MIPLLVAGQLDLQAQILDVQVLGPPLLFQGPLLFSVALTRLTRQLWCDAMRRREKAPEPKVPEPQNVCRTCGADISKRKSYCSKCAMAAIKRTIIVAAHEGRKASQGPSAQKRRRETGRRQWEAYQAWNPAELPKWLTNDVYLSQLQLRLAGFTRPAIAAVMGVTTVYAGEVRNGNCIPHQRHWQKLANLVGVTASG